MHHAILQYLPASGAGTSSTQLFRQEVTASTAPKDVYLGLEQPEWIELTYEQDSNVTVCEMHVVVTPAKCRENSTKLICFQIHRRNTSASNSVPLDGQCSNGVIQKNYSKVTLPPGELLFLQIAVCPHPSYSSSGVEAPCNIISPDCLCVNACLPMWVALWLDAVYSSRKYLSIYV